MSRIFHRHKWTDWVVTDRGQTLHAGYPVGWYAVQQRHCLACGKTQVDEQVNYGGNSPSFCTRRSDMVKRVPRKDGVAA